jgi:hypothetical protein
MSSSNSKRKFPLILNEGKRILETMIIPSEVPNDNDRK